MNRILCPACRHGLGYPDEHAGAKVKCSKCGHKFLLPRAAAALPVECELVAPPRPTASLPLHLASAASSFPRMGVGFWPGTARTCGCTTCARGSKC